MRGSRGAARASKTPHASALSAAAVIRSRTTLRACARSLISSPAAIVRRMSFDAVACRNDSIARQSTAAHRSAGISFGARNRTSIATASAAGPS